MFDDNALLKTRFYLSFHMSFHLSYHNFLINVTFQKPLFLNLLHNYVAACKYARDLLQSNVNKKCDFCQEKFCAFQGYDPVSKKAGDNPISEKKRGLKMASLGPFKKRKRFLGSGG